MNSLYCVVQVLKGENYGRAVDWWAIGVVIYEMTCGRLPFKHEDQTLLFRLIVKDEEVSVCGGESLVSLSFLSHELVSHSSTVTKPFTSFFKVIAKCS